MKIKRRACVRAECDIQTVFISQAEAALVSFDHMPGLVDRCGWDTASGAARGRRRQCGKCRDHEYALLLHHGTGFVIHQRRMLNGKNAGSQGIFHPARAVSMGGHVSALPSRLLHCRAQFIDSHLRFVGRRAGREHTSRGDDLDYFSARLEFFPDRASDRLGAGCLPPDESGMAARHADRATRGHDARPRGHAGGNGLLQRKDGMVATPHVSDGCKAGFDCAAGGQSRLEQVHLDRF